MEVTTVTMGEEMGEVEEGLVVVEVVLVVDVEVVGAIIIRTMRKSYAQHVPQMVQSFATTVKHAIR